MSEDTINSDGPVKKPRGRKASTSANGAGNASAPHPGQAEDAGTQAPDYRDATGAPAAAIGAGTALAVTETPSDQGALGAAAAKVSAMIPENMTDKAREVATDVKDKASDGIQGLARIISDSAGAIDDNVGPKYGDYARTAAQSINDAADRLRAKPVDEIAEDTREFVRTKPAAALGIAAVASLMLAKIFGSIFGKKR